MRTPSERTSGLVTEPVNPGRTWPVRRPVLPDWARGPEFYVLVAAVAVTAGFGGYVQAVLVAGIFVITVAIWHQRNVRARWISGLACAEATVVRDGGPMRVPVERLVPGDVVRLATGDRVPADVRITEAHLLEAADEEAESADRLQAGTTVTRGAARAVVTAAGSPWRPAPLARDTVLGRKLDAFCHRVSTGALAVAAVMLIITVARGGPVADLVIAAVALTIGATPAGLPTVASVALTAAALRMSRRNAVPRRLSAVERLAGTTVICADKTGTFTGDRMTVTTISAGGRTIDVRALPDLLDPALRECALAGLLCNECELSLVDGHWQALGDPTDTALIPVAELAGLDPPATRARHPRTELVPFEPERRLMASVHGAAYAKGAVEEILARCEYELTSDGGIRPVDADAVLRRARAFADDGLRVLAFARFEPGADSLAGEVDRGGWTFLGLQAMRDPVRPAAIESVAACRAGGIAVKMITGDHPDTAAAIAGSVGLRENPPVLTGAELDLLDDDRLDGVVADIAVFARIAPGQKLRLVRALQRRGETVAMTGDGLSDVPALQHADVGIAMGEGGTDAARDVAGVVLADDSFTAIADAVTESRATLRELRGFLAWALPSCLCAAMFVMIAIATGIALRTAPVLLLVVNLTTTVALGLLLRRRRTAPRPPIRAPRRDRRR